MNTFFSPTKAAITITGSHIHKHRYNNTKDREQKYNQKYTKVMPGYYKEYSI